MDSWSYVRQPDVTGYPVSLSKVYFCINLVQPKKGLNVKYWGSWSQPSKDKVDNSSV